MVSAAVALPDCRLWVFSLNKYLPKTGDTTYPQEETKSAKYSFPFITKRSNTFLYLYLYRVTPFTTRLTVPVGDGVSGVLPTFTEASSETVCPTMTKGNAR